jgi:hypothetical protein
LFAVELGLEPAPCPATLPSDQYIVSRCRPTFAGQHAPTTLSSPDFSALFRTVTYQKIGSLA